MAELQRNRIVTQSTNETIIINATKAPGTPFGMGLRAVGKDGAVKNTKPGSAAERCGVKAGDIIMAIGDLSLEGKGMGAAVKALKEATGDFQMYVRRYTSNMAGSPTKPLTPQATTPTPTPTPVPVPTPMTVVSSEQPVPEGFSSLFTEDADTDNNPATTTTQTPNDHPPSHSEQQPRASELQPPQVTQQQQQQQQQQHQQPEGLSVLFDNDTEPSEDEAQLEPNNDQPPSIVTTTPASQREADSPTSEDRDLSSGFQQPTTPLPTTTPPPPTTTTTPTTTTPVTAPTTTPPTPSTTTTTTTSASTTTTAIASPSSVDRGLRSVGKIPPSVTKAEDAIRKARDAWAAKEAKKKAEADDTNTSVGSHDDRGLRRSSGSSPSKGPLHLQKKAQKDLADAIKRAEWWEAERERRKLAVGVTVCDNEGSPSMSNLSSPTSSVSNSPESERSSPIKKQTRFARLAEQMGIEADDNQDDVDERGLRKAR